MRDRSTLSPENALFPDDERTTAQRYEDCRRERDDLEVQVRTLTETIINLITGQVAVDDVAALLGQEHDYSLRTQKASQTRQRHALAGAQPVVYYLRRDADTIKIGLTTSILARLQAFHAQPADLLAVEPGSRGLEQGRHAQFASERIGRTELFRFSNRLAAHVKTLQVKRPNPLDTAKRLNQLGEYAHHELA